MRFLLWSGLFQLDGLLESNGDRNTPRPLGKSRREGIGRNRELHHFLKRAERVEPQDLLLVSGSGPGIQHAPAKPCARAGF